MRRGPRVTGAVLASVLALAIGAAGCSDDDTDAPGDATSQAERLADEAGLAASAVVDAVCDGWATDRPDRPTVNEYVRDLLLPLELVNRPDRPDYDEEAIDALVVEACADEADDPSAFLLHVRDGLGLDADDLDGLVAAACDRYRTQQARIAAGDWSGQDLADVIRQLALGQGVELAALRAAIAGICRG